MRTMNSIRNFGSSKAEDIQTIIDDQAVTVTRYRITGGFRDNAKTRTSASFQARIDPWRNIQREPRENKTGLESDVLFLMVTRWGTDKNGNTIDFRQGDEISDGTNTYVVAAKIPYSGIKCEGMLALKQ